MKFPPLLLFLVLSMPVIGQTESETVEKENVLISLGYGIHSNSLNSNSYMEFKDGSYNDLDNLQTVTIKVAFPTSKDYLQYFVGALVETDLRDDTSSGYSPGNTNSKSHVLNGGGVFAGIRPVWKKQNFGLTSEFALGAFSYKETYSHFNNISQPYLDIHDEKNSFGIGAYSSVGFYLKIGRVGINPNINAVWSGGDNASFFFYGASLPLTFQF